MCIILFTILYEQESILQEKPLKLTEPKSSLKYGEFNMIISSYVSSSSPPPPPPPPDFSRSEFVVCRFFWSVRIAEIFSPIKWEVGPKNGGSWEVGLKNWCEVGFAEGGR